MTLGVDGPSMFCLQRQARALPDGVIEIIERAFKRMDKSERGSLINHYVRVAD